MKRAKVLLCMVLSLLMLVDYTVFQPAPAMGAIDTKSALIGGAVGVAAGAGIALAAPAIGSAVAGAGAAIGVLICSMLDIFTVVLLAIPIYGNGSDLPVAVQLFQLTGIQKWIVWLFFVLLLITVLNGISGTIISQLDKPIWSRHRLITGIFLLVICSSVFIITRQPYAGIFCFAILVIKCVLIYKMRLH